VFVRSRRRNSAKQCQRAFCFRVTKATSELKRTLPEDYRHCLQYISLKPVMKNRRVSIVRTCRVVGKRPKDLLQPGFDPGTLTCHIRLLSFLFISIMRYQLH
jgi:hypothetical protein